MSAEKPKLMTRQYVKAASEQLTSRQKLILHSLYECRFLTTEQIRRLHFPRVSEKNGAPVSRCMRKLERLGFVEVRRRKDGGLNVYLLGPAGLALTAVREKLRADAFRRTYLSDVSMGLFAGHQRAINDILVSFKQEEHKARGTLSEWSTDRTFWYEFRILGRKYRLFPDARGAWHDGVTSIVVPFVVEVDRGSMSLRFLEEKFRQYLLLYKSKAFDPAPVPLIPPVLLVVTSSPARAEMLNQRVLAAMIQENVRPEDVRLFMTIAVTDTGTLERNGVLEKIWQVPLGGPRLGVVELSPERNAFDAGARRISRNR